MGAAEVRHRNVTHRSAARRAAKGREMSATSGRRESAARVVVVCARSQWSESYAVRISGPGNVVRMPCQR